MEQEVAAALEREILLREMKPAKPVGLRYDRLANQGLLRLGDASVPGPETVAHWYHMCNTMLVSNLMAGRKRVIIGGKEGTCNDSTDRDLDGVVADSSILLRGELEACLKEFRRSLRPGGRLVLLLANWDYEMAGKDVSFETSFKRYGGDVYLGVVKRTLNPPKETEYICLLDGGEDLVKKLARMTRDELRRLTVADVTLEGRHILSLELIDIPQATEVSLREACDAAGFSNVMVAGAPGVLAARLFGAHSSMILRTLARPDELASLMREVCLSLSTVFPFVDASDNPHIVAVCTRPE